MVLVGSTVGGGVVWGKWLLACFSFSDFGRAKRLRLFGFIAPALAAIGLLAILHLCASTDVRNSALYLGFYIALGGAHLALVMVLSGLCGLSFRDDWLERRNLAAAVAGTGVLFGGMFAFAGANIGDGPGWWVVVFCALLSTSALMIAWLVYAKLTDAMDAICVGRNVPAAFRLGSFLVLVGVVAGRSVAGDWHDTTSTIVDFGRQILPLIPYAIGIGLIDARLDPSQTGRTWLYSINFACLHLAAIVVYFYWVGPWS